MVQIRPKKLIENLNTVKIETYIWKQFEDFCKQRNYKLRAETTDEEMANILKDRAVNMKRNDGSDYKEGVVKTIWNVSAKLPQKKKL